MKTLGIIQTLSKIGRILSKIIFVCCVVGFAICITAFVPVIIMDDNIFTFGDVYIHNIADVDFLFNRSSLFCALIQCSVFCAGEAVLAQFAVHYFAREIKDGTPFNPDGANELFRLGILAIVIPIATGLISEIINSLFIALYGTVDTLIKLNASPLLFGVMFICMSLLCRLGAENKC